MRRIVVWRSIVSQIFWPSLLEKDSWEGETPVIAWKFGALAYDFYESSCSELQLKFGGKFHLKLNIGGVPIVHKYCEGKIQINLKRELKSTWKFLKGSKGNQFQSLVIFLLLLVARALWLCMVQHRLFAWDKSSVCRRPSYGVSAFRCYPGLGWGQSMCESND